MIDQTLDGLEFSLSASIEDWILSICVDVIGVATILNQPLSEQYFTISARIIERCLTQSIDLRWIDAQALKNISHLYCEAIIRNDRASEYQMLIEVCTII